MERDAISKKLEEFIRDRFQVTATDKHFSRDVHLFEEGYVDSVGVVELIAFVEANFDVEFPDDFLFSEEFTRINGISGQVKSLLDGGTP